MSQTTDRYLIERANDGATYLDAEEPGWAERINVEGLDMSIGDPDRFDDPGVCGCVLAQLYGSFEEGRSVLVLNANGSSAWEQSEDLGFVSPRMADYPVLDAAWRAQVKARTT